MGRLIKPRTTQQDFITIIDDYSTPNITYIGKSVLSTDAALTDNQIWQIQIIDETQGLRILWADGNADFDKVWDNRTLLNYN